MFWHRAPAESCCSQMGVFFGSWTGRRDHAQDHGRAERQLHLLGQLVVAGIWIAQAAGGGEDFAELEARLALDDQHAPRLQLAMVRHAHAEAQDRVEICPPMAPARLSTFTGVDRRSASRRSVSGEACAASSGVPNSGSGGRSGRIGIGLVRLARRVAVAIIARDDGRGLLDNRCAGQGGVDGRLDARPVIRLHHDAVDDEGGRRVDALAAARRC